MRTRKGNNRLSKDRLTFDYESKQNTDLFMGHSLAPDVDQTHEEGLSEEVDVEDATSNHAP